MSLLLESLRSGIWEMWDYLSAHVLTCLVPAFFIAGAIAVFVSGPAVLKYFGAGTRKWLAYSVASVSGVFLAVCSCTVLPLFAGIHRKGAGLGPAITFLYSGPAINLLAIVLTARVLGLGLGVARAVAAIVFAIVIGLLMALIFRGEEAGRISRQGGFAAAAAEPGLPMGKSALFIILLVAILLTGTARIDLAWKLTGLGVLLALTLWAALTWFTREEAKSWLQETWKLAKLIFPMLLLGVFIAGILKVLVPQAFIARWVGGNSLLANLLAAGFGVLMYFSTLTEIPILSTFLGMGMGSGPALALLLAGPALSLPSLLAIRSVLGTKKTLVYAGLVLVMATISGLVYGALSL